MAEARAREGWPLLPSPTPGRPPTWPSIGRRHGDQTHTAPQAHWSTIGKIPRISTTVDIVILANIIGSQSWGM